MIRLQCSGAHPVDVYTLAQAIDPQCSKDKTNKQYLDQEKRPDEVQGMYEPSQDDADPLDSHESERGDDEEAHCPSHREAEPSRVKDAHAEERQPDEEDNKEFKAENNRSEGLECRFFFLTAHVGREVMRPLFAR